jgi:hypothetical protein
MENYLQLLEILAFFSGYPLIYLLVKYLNQFRGIQRFTKQALLVLPFVYGFIGIFFLGLQLKTLSITLDLAHFQHPYLVIWGIISIVFLFPIFSKQPSFSLFHSLIFLFVLISKFFFKSTSLEEKSQVISNYMNIYTISIALNLVLLILVMAVSFLLKKIKYRSA